MVTLVLIGFVGGLITGISPCVLPVLPVIFLSAGGARRGQEATGRRPLAGGAGLTLSFSVFTVLGTLVLRALPVPQDIIRWAGIVDPGAARHRHDRAAVRGLAGAAVRPARRSGAPGRDRGGFLLGLALGAVYVPCAGPGAGRHRGGRRDRAGSAPSTLALTVAFASARPSRC